MSSPALYLVPDGACPVPGGPSNQRPSAHRPPCSHLSVPDPCGRAYPPSYRRGGSELLQACVGRGDDPDAWLELHQRFALRFESRLVVATHGMGIFLSADEPQELRQELMIRFFTCEQPFRGRTEEEFWCFVNTSVHNLAVDFARYLRARRRRSTRHSMRVSSTDLCRDRSEVQALRSREPDPEAILLRRELQLQLIHTVERLFPGRPEHLDAVVLTVLVGLTSREASFELRGALNPKQIDHILNRLRHRSGLPDGLFKRRGGSVEKRLYTRTLPPTLKVRFNPAREPMLGRNGELDPTL